MSNIPAPDVAVRWLADICFRLEDQFPEPKLGKSDSMPDW